MLVSGRGAIRDVTFSPDGASGRFLLLSLEGVDIWDAITGMRWYEGNYDVTDPSTMTIFTSLLCRHETFTVTSVT